jgi:hypothetical protein
LSPKNHDDSNILKFRNQKPTPHKNAGWKSSEEIIDRIIELENRCHQLKQKLEQINLLKLCALLLDHQNKEMDREIKRLSMIRLHAIYWLLIGLVYLLTKSDHL